MSSHNQRGQSLLLFSLTLLLLTLMVLLTLSLGMRTREKMELQIAADAAAYSNAVATARTYNNISIMNRLQVSYWVAMAASQSLISWTGYGRGMLVEGAQAARRIAARNGGRSRCQRELRRNAQELAAQLEAANAAIDGDWERDDQAAGTDTRNIQGLIAGLREETERLSGVNRPDAPDQTAYPGSLVDVLKNQTLTRDIARIADKGSPTPGEITERRHDISHREVDCRVSGLHDPSGNGSYGGAPGICSHPDWNIRMLQAAMGSRGNPFVTNRTQVPSNSPIYSEHVPSIAEKGHRIAGNLLGAATWGDGREDFSGTTTAIAWAEDHGQVTVTVNAPNAGCSDSASESLLAFVRSTHIADNSDRHEYGGDSDPDRSEHHTMGSCNASCPSVWVRALKFEDAGPEDLYGQPKNYAVLQRDYGMRPGGDIAPDANADDWDPNNPWNLSFRFRFTQGGAGQIFDNRGVRLNDGTSIRRQVAVATGLAYYHRQGYWEEYPNFLNPFWRATLVAADVDRTASGDLSHLLSADGWQQDTFERLVQAGFRGFH